MQRQPVRTAPARKPVKKPQPAKKAAPSGTQARVRRDLLVLLLIGIVAGLGAWFLQKACPGGFPLKVKGKTDAAAVTEIANPDGVRLNEVMSVNGGASSTEAGLFPDWVEVMNNGSSDADLEGWTLGRTAKAKGLFVFPSVVLRPGECVQVFCDGHLNNEPGEEFHAPFVLKSKGDTLMLFNASGTAVDTANIPALERNQVYVRGDDGLWSVSDEYTPGLPNTQENRLSFKQIVLDSPIVISEVMARNITTYADPTGLYADYIELRNISDRPVDLSGYHLSDSNEKSLRWTFPQGTVIEAGGVLVVFASGRDTIQEGSLHTSFRLSSAGEAVVLTTPRGQLLDYTEYPAMGADVAWTRGPDGTFGTDAEPTPGE